VQSSDTEAALVQQAIKRDQAAFTELYELHVDRIFRHVIYQVPDRTDAEDITQEVFVKAWQSIHRYRWTGAPIITWLIVIARNAVTDYYRGRKNVRPLDETDDPRSAENPVEAAESKFNSIEIRKAVLELKGDKQAVILMRFIDGLSYEEIAGALKKSEGAIRVIQHRALSDLRKILARSGLQ